MRPHFWIVTEEGIEEVKPSEYYSYKGEKFISATQNYAMEVVANWLLAYR